MERTHEILAVMGIDRGLATDGGIDLRQQGGWHLHIIESTADHGSRKARKVAHHATAERQHEIAALDAGLDQCLAHTLEHRKALRPFARWHHHRRSSRDVGERLLRGSKAMPGHGLVADDRHSRTRAQRFDALAERAENAAPDHDVVAAGPKRDVDNDGLAGPQRRGHDAQSPPPVAWPAVAGSNPRCFASTPSISSTIFSCTTSRD